MLRQWVGQYWPLHPTWKTRIEQKNYLGEIESLLYCTLDTFTKGDPDIGPHLFKAFRPSIIGPIYNRVMKIELEIGGVTI